MFSKPQRKLDTRIPDFRTKSIHIRLQRCICVKLSFDCQLANTAKVISHAKTNTIPIENNILFDGKHKFSFESVLKCTNGNHNHLVHPPNANIASHPLLAKFIEQLRFQSRHKTHYSYFVCDCEMPVYEHIFCLIETVLWIGTQNQTKPNEYWLRVHKSVLDFLHTNRWNT